jgi:hypothetical protein
MKRLLYRSTWRRIEMWAFAVVVVAGAVAIAVLAWGLVESNHHIDRASHANCVDTRELVQKILLRTLNASYDDWLARPERVLEKYRSQLERSSSFNYGADKARIEDAVRRTADVLALSDPDLCR